MRLWTLHPRYLDAMGLVALWREALLAQKVLIGHTRGYKHHPQLQRFQRQSDPVAAIATYLWSVEHEATARGYRFDAGKIIRSKTTLHIGATRGQLEYEMQHLRRKLRVRDPLRYRSLKEVTVPKAHPLFRVHSGKIESWEIGAQ